MKRRYSREYYHWRRRIVLKFARGGCCGPAPREYRDWCELSPSRQRRAAEKPADDVPRKVALG